MDSLRSRYPAALVIIHWLVVALILGAWLSADDGDDLARQTLVFHFLFGIAVLALVVPRLLLRLFGDAPDRTPGLAGRIAVGMHGLLYLLMIALPLSGWYLASLAGIDIALGGVHLPALAAPSDRAADALGDIHEVMGNLILILAGLHAAAALWHQFVLCDGTLARMRLR